MIRQDGQLRELSIDDIIAAHDVIVERVITPGWGGFVYVRNMESDRLDAYNRAASRLVDDKDGVGVRALAAGMSLCDEQGNFKNPTKAQIMAFGQKSGADMDLVAAKALELNNVSQEDIDKLEGKSEQTTDTESAPSSDTKAE